MQIYQPIVYNVNLLSKAKQIMNQILLEIFSILVYQNLVSQPDIDINIFILESWLTVLKLSCTPLHRRAKYSELYQILK